MIKNLIFDWSWTLSDDLTTIHTATMKVFEKLWLRILTLDEYKEEFTLPYMNFYHKFKKDAIREEVDILYIKEINSLDKPKPFKSTEIMLKSLNEKGLNMVILSSHPQENLEKEIKSHWLEKFFMQINWSIHDKSEAIVETIKKHDFKPQETAYVWDMEHDIRAGKAAKVRTIAVTWGYQTRSRLSHEFPDYMIDDLRELEKLITL